MPYVIDQSATDVLHAGSKARDDANCILARNGAQLVHMICSYSDKPGAIVRDLFSMHNQIMRSLSGMNKGDIALLQFPFRCFYTNSGRSFAQAAFKKGIKTVARVHDLDSLRRGNALNRKGKLSFTEKLHYDIAFLKCFDRVISHNQRMTQYLVEMGIDEEKIIDSGLFGYLRNEVEWRIVEKLVIRQPFGDKLYG